MTYNEPIAGIGESSVVILGRRHNGDYDTEFDFISCIGEYIQRNDPAVKVIDELQFINQLYPWFEPRTAPLDPRSLDKLLRDSKVAEQFAIMQLEYIIWIDGETRGGFDGNINRSGAMSCGLQGCFGFGTWGTESEYEATIWDFTDRIEVGKVSAEASGQSYMPAIFVPIPIVAPVQDSACDSVGQQLLEYLSALH
jgi:hypothetical protein